MSWKSFLVVGLVFLAPTANAKTVDQSVMERLIEHASLSSLLKSKSEEVRRELICLSLNAYHEARSSTVLDQIAATFVAKNRYEENYRGAETVCDVVWHWRQFSWTHDGKSDFPKDKTAWERAQRIAFLVFHNEQYGLEDPTDGKMHYVRHDVVQKFKWTRTATNKQQIGAHVYLVPAGYK